MGFWDSYNKEMVRHGYTSHSEFFVSDDEVESELEYEGLSTSVTSDDVVDLDPVCYLSEMETARAAEQGDFETAFQKYTEALDQGNMRMLLKIADLLAVAAVYDRYNRPYRIGSDKDRDYSLECALTFYMVSLIVPECESEAEDHLNILREQCSDEYDFQIMIQRVSDRISESILKDPISFVRAILSQYRKTRS